MLGTELEFGEINLVYHEHWKHWTPVNVSEIKHCWFYSIFPLLNRLNTRTKLANQLPTPYSIHRCENIKLLISLSGISTLSVFSSHMNRMQSTLVLLDVSPPQCARQNHSNRVITSSVSTESERSSFSSRTSSHCSLWCIQKNMDINNESHHSCQLLRATTTITVKWRAMCIHICINYESFTYWTVMSARVTPTPVCTAAQWRIHKCD